MAGPDGDVRVRVEGQGQTDTVVDSVNGPESTDESRVGVLSDPSLVDRKTRRTLPDDGWVRVFDSPKESGSSPKIYDFIG